MKRISKKIFDVVSDSAPVKKIKITDKKALRQLAKEQHFHYGFHFNKRTKLKLFLAPVHLLNGQLGVYTEQYIKPGKHLIGCYAGKRYAVGKESDESLYVFEVGNKDDEVVEFIDGEKYRDWTNFVNHSMTPNLEVYQRRIKGKMNVCFYVWRPIKKGEQLLFDYGRSYFNNLKHYYIHRTDNWQTEAEKYISQQSYYLPGLYQFDKHLAQDLNLHHSRWLMPVIFEYILTNDTRALAKTLSQKYPVDLLAYAVSNKKIAALRYQQHLTALMLACYLGAEACIDILLQYRADVDRCMLVSGYLPLVTLCKGLADSKAVTRIGKKLLQRMHFPFVIDNDKKSLVHYIIHRGDEALLKILLNKVSKVDDVKAFASIIRRADILFCIENKKFTLLEIIYKAMKHNEMKAFQVPTKLLKTLTKKDLARFKSIHRILSS